MDVVAKPNENADTSELVVLTSVGSSNYHYFRTFTTDNLSYVSQVSDPIINGPWDLAYVHYGWEGFGETIPEPLTFILLFISILGLKFKKYYR